MLSVFTFVIAGNILGNIIHLLSRFRRKEAGTTAIIVSGCLGIIVLITGLWGTSFYLLHLEYFLLPLYWLTFFTASVLNIYSGLLPTMHLAKTLLPKLDSGDTKRTGKLIALLAARQKPIGIAGIILTVWCILYGIIFSLGYIRI